MKRYLSILLLLVVGLSGLLYAQAPQKFSYQAVVRTQFGQLVTNQPVGVRISILRYSALGASVYSESQTVTTNANGLFTMAVGEGTVLSGNLNAINWADGPYFLKSEIDPQGGTSYSIVATKQMMSVPYSLFALRADTSSFATTAQWAQNIVGGFQESQILTMSHDTIFLTGGSFVVLPTGFSGNYNDLTNKPVIPTVPTSVSAFTNDAGYITGYTEVQALSISHDTIFLTGGSFVKIPAGFSGDYNDLTNKPTIPTVPTNVSNFTNDAGYITSADIPAGFSGDYNDLTNKPTIPTVPSNVSAFTNDAGYLTNYTESQTLADVVANSNSAGHSQIKNVNDPTDPKDAVNLQYLTAQLARLQHQLDSLGAIVASTGDGSGDEGSTPPTTFTDGVLPGVFSVAADRTVKFSQGNLQYTTTGTHAVSGGGTVQGTWRFAEHQYDFVGNSTEGTVNHNGAPCNNENISSSYSGWIDLFGRGTSGWNSGENAYQPWSISIFNNDYYSGSLSGSYAKADWGVFNAISNGGNLPEQWRTLTKDEWAYLLNTRTTTVSGVSSNARFCKATVTGIAGLVIFPDNYIHPTGNVSSLQSINDPYPDFTVNNLTAEEWQYMEQAGAVFLPVAGSRNGTTLTEVGTHGHYWSSSYYHSIYAYQLDFRNGNVDPGGINSHYTGQSVRLVQDIVETSHTACDSYSWHGTTYTESGDYAFGSELLHLTINHSTHNSETQSTSGCYSWHETVYPSTGTYTYDYTNPEGCPSTDTLHLNVNNASPSALDITVNGYTFRMIQVEGGTFNMGAQSTDPSGINYDPDASPDQSPVHSVTLCSYYIGQTEVTEGLWEAVMGSDVTTHGAFNGIGSNYPITFISYYDAQSFITLLSHLTGLNFRMPTEAEWEYAARGGSQSQGYKYSGSNNIDDVAWCFENVPGGNWVDVLHPVATKQANELGLYDMTGSMSEWCSDWYGNYSSSPQTNPTGPDSGSGRVSRSGPSIEENVWARTGAFNQGYRYSFTGLRLALSEYAPTNPPMVSTASVSNITGTTVSCGGNVTFSGDTPVIARGVCWATSENPTIFDSHTTDGSGMGSFTSSITGLTAGTIYYVRAYATNGSRTSYGPQVSFTTESVTLSTRDFTVNGVTFSMIQVEGGTFNMGAQNSDPSGVNYYAGAIDNESPVHDVTLSSYYIGQTEVTQGLWHAVMGSDVFPQVATSPYYSGEVGDSYPAWGISYNDAQNFIAQLNILTGLNFRLPTEAEWEYAARGGNQSHGYKFSGSNTIDNVAWYLGNSGDRLHPVASKQANELGIYDMTGNLFEWCSDWHGDYSDISQTNPTGPGSGTRHVIRGGCYTFTPHHCHTRFRVPPQDDHGSIQAGMRLVLSE